MVSRRRYSAEFKAQVALEALRGDQTINEIAARHALHPNQILQWKKHLLSAAPELFTRGKSQDRRTEEALKDNLYQEIGKLKVELEFLKKKSRYEY